MTATPPLPPIPPGSVAGVVAAITGTQSPSAASAHPILREFGVVQSWQAGPPPTLTVAISGGAAVAGIPYKTSYNPHTGDTVLIDRVDAAVPGLGDRIVDCAIAGAVTSDVGALKCFAKSAAPFGWLLADGSAFSAATYPLLNSYLGGTTLPDMRDRLPMGAGSNVGLGAVAGAATHTLTSSEMPSHNHSHNHTVPYNDVGVTGGVGLNNTSPGYFGGGAHSATSSTDSTSTGSGNAHSILPPVRGVAWFIKAT